MKDDAILGLEDIYQEGKVSRLVLMESDTPEGYRSMKEYRFYFRKIREQSGLVVCKSLGDRGVRQLQCHGTGR